MLAWAWATLREVEETLARIVSELDARAYAHVSGGGDPPGYGPLPPGSVDAAWTESEVPLSVLDGSRGLAHLTYSVSVEDAPVGGLTRQQDEVDLLTTVQVAFCYELRPGCAREDYRRSQDAAHMVARAILSEAPFPIELANMYRPGRIIDGKWLEVAVLFTVYAVAEL